MKGLMNGVKLDEGIWLPIKVTIFYGFCVLTKLAYIKLSNPCFWTLFLFMSGNVPREVPPKCCERRRRATVKSLILSAIAIGKGSNPILESLVKTDTSSKDF